VKHLRAKKMTVKRHKSPPKAKRLMMTKMNRMEISAKLMKATAMIKESILWRRE